MVVDSPVEGEGSLAAEDTLADLVGLSSAVEGLGSLEETDDLDAADTAAAVGRRLAVDLASLEDAGN